MTSQLIVLIALAAYILVWQIWRFAKGVDRWPPWPARSRYRAPLSQVPQTAPPPVRFLPPRVVALGEEFEFNFEEKPTTAYRWTCIPSEGVELVGEPRLVPSSTSSAAPGGARATIFFRLRAIRPGPTCATFRHGSALHANVARCDIFVHKTAASTTSPPAPAPRGPGQESSPWGDEKVSLETADAIALALRELHVQLGDDAFYEERKRLLTMLSERLPELRKERRAVASALREGAGYSLQGYASLDLLNSDVTWRAHKLANAIGIPFDLALATVWALAYAFELGPLPSAAPPPAELSYDGDRGAARLRTH